MTMEGSADETAMPRIEAESTLASVSVRLISSQALVQYLWASCSDQPGRS